MAELVGKLGPEPLRHQPVATDQPTKFDPGSPEVHTKNWGMPSTSRLSAVAVIGRGFPCGAELADVTATIRPKTATETRRLRKPGPIFLPLPFPLPPFPFFPPPFCGRRLPCPPPSRRPRSDRCPPLSAVARVGTVDAILIVPVAVVAAARCRRRCSHRRCCRRPLLPPPLFSSPPFVRRRHRHRPPPTAAGIPVDTVRGAVPAGRLRGAEAIERGLIRRHTRSPKGSGSPFDGSRAVFGAPGGIDARERKRSL